MSPCPIVAVTATLAHFRTTSRLGQPIRNPSPPTWCRTAAAAINIGAAVAASTHCIATMPAPPAAFLLSIIRNDIPTAAPSG
jgi:hypothetical protein